MRAAASAGASRRRDPDALGAYSPDEMSATDGRPRRGSRLALGGVMLALLGTLAWLVLVFVPERRLARALERIEVAERELERPVDRPAIGGEPRDCESSATLAAPALAIEAHASISDVDRPRDIAYPPHPYHGLPDLGTTPPPDDPYEALAWARPDRDDALAFLDAARCSRAARAVRGADGHLTHPASRSAMVALANLRGEPAACLRATAAIVRLLEDVAPSDDVFGERSYAEPTIELATSVGLACAREAPAELAVSVARALRELDAGTLDGWIADGMRAELVTMARSMLEGDRGGSVWRWLHRVQDERFVEAELDAADRWAAIRSHPERERIAALSAPAYHVSPAVDARALTARRARVRAYVIALEALAAAPPGEAPVPVPAAIDLVDPLGGTPLGARTADDGALEVFRAGAAGAEPEVLVRALARR